MLKFWAPASQLVLVPASQPKKYECVQYKSSIIQEELFSVVKMRFVQEVNSLNSN